MSIELWKSIFDWGTIVLVGLAMVFGAGALVTGSIITERKDRAIAEEQRKTAEAPAKAAQAQLALRKAAEYAATTRRIIMGDRTTNRGSDEKVRQARFQELGKHSAAYAVTVYVQEEEAQILAFDVRAALLKSGWKFVTVENLASTHIPLGFIEEGVQVRTMLPKNPSDLSIPPSGATPPPVASAVIDLLALDFPPLVHRLE